MTTIFIIIISIFTLIWMVNDIKKGFRQIMINHYKIKELKKEINRIKFKK